jgi:hypothetical protein
MASLTIRKMINRTTRKYLTIAPTTIIVQVTTTTNATIIAEIIAIKITKMAKGKSSIHGQCNHATEDSNVKRKHMKTNERIGQTVLLVVLIIATMVTKIAIIPIIVTITVLMKIVTSPQPISISQ